MMDYIWSGCLIALAAGMLACMYRLLAGPSVSDRIAALDTLGIHILAAIAVYSLLYRTQVYLELILVIGILTFIGTAMFARYMERGVVLEHGDRESDR